MPLPDPSLDLPRRYLVGGTVPLSLQEIRLVGVAVDAAQSPSAPTSRVVGYGKVCVAAEAWAK